MHVAPLACGRSSIAQALLGLSGLRAATAPTPSSPQPTRRPHSQALASVRLLFLHCRRRSGLGMGNPSQQPCLQALYALCVHPAPTSTHCNCQDRHCAAEQKPIRLQTPSLNPPLPPSPPPTKSPEQIGEEVVAHWKKAEYFFSKIVKIDARLVGRANGWLVASNRRCRKTPNRAPPTSPVPCLPPPANAWCRSSLTTRAADGRPWTQSMLVCFLERSGGDGTGEVLVVVRSPADPPDQPFLASIARRVHGRDCLLALHQGQLQPAQRDCDLRLVRKRYALGWVSCETILFLGPPADHMTESTPLNPSAGFHQKCHSPRISDATLKSPDAWYCSPCQKKGRGDSGLFALQSLGMPSRS